MYTLLHSVTPLSHSCYASLHPVALCYTSLNSVTLCYNPVTLLVTLCYTLSCYSLLHLSCNVWLQLAPTFVAETSRPFPHPLSLLIACRWCGRGHGRADLSLEQPEEDSVSVPS